MLRSLFFGTWLVVVGLGAGCGGGDGGGQPPPGPPGPPPAGEMPFASGSRFQARYLLAPDTEPLLLGVHDRQRGVDCVVNQYGDGPATCAPITRSVLEPSDPADLVPGEIRLVMKSNRLGVRELTTADGARFPLMSSGRVGIFDTQWAAACGPGANSCVPAAASHDEPFALFADASCLQPLGLTTGPSEQRPLLVLVRGVAHAVGEAWTGSVFQKIQGNCGTSSFTSGGGLGLWRSGDPLPAGALAPLRWVAIGGGRLGLRAVESEGRVVAPLHEARTWQADFPSYLDRERGLDCVPVRTTSAGVRCVGGVGWSSERDLLFLDDGCTQVVARNNQFAQVATTRPTSILITARKDTLLAEARSLRRVADWVDNLEHPLYRRQDDGSCKLNSQTKVDWAVLAEEQPWDGFARLEEWRGSERVVP